MSIYSICPQYLKAACDDKDQDVAQIFYRHFLPKSPCRLAVDEGGFVVGTLAENAFKSEVISHFLDRVSNCKATKRNAIEPLETPSIVDDFDVVVHHLEEQVGDDGRIICLSGHHYKHSFLRKVDRSIVSQFLESDCSIEGGDKVNNYMKIVGDNYGAAFMGDGNDVKFEVDIDEIDNKSFSDEDIEKILSGLQLGKEQASTAGTGSAVSHIEKCIDALKSDGVKACYKMMLKAKSDIRPFIHGAYSILVGIMSGG